MRIAFFISDHGFGHIMRNLPVIKEVVKRGHEAVLICAKKQLQIAERYLGDTAVKYVPYHTDAGVLVKPGTLVMDKEKTAEAVDDYICEFPKRIRFATDLLKEYEIARVVADIVPWALSAASEAGVSSYLMASFTWLEQYEGFVPEKNLSVLRSAFQSADHILYYDLANKPTRELLGPGTEIGFVAREYSSEEVKKIRAAHQRKIVFLSLGGSNVGLNFDIDVRHLPYDFITTKALRLIGENVQRLDESVLNMQDYIKAADYCIAKAGWGTVSEMMLAGTKFAVLKRPDVAEDTMTIEELERRHAAFGIEVEKLKDMAAVIDELEHYDRVVQTYENGYRKAADLILADKMLKKKISTEKRITCLDELWDEVVAFQGYPFYTVSGLPFTYTLKVGKNGEYCKELLVDRRTESKSLTWSSVVLAFEHALEMKGKKIGRPKELGDIRGISYIYPMLYRFGLIDVPDAIAEKIKIQEQKRSL
jgi:hypothetical protein